MGEEQAFWKRDQLHLENLLVGFPPSCPQTFAHEVARPRGPVPLHPHLLQGFSEGRGFCSPPPAPIPPALKIMRPRKCHSQLSQASHGYFSSLHSILFSQELIIVLWLTVCLASHALITNSTLDSSWCVNVLSRRSNTPRIQVISSKRKSLAAQHPGFPFAVSWEAPHVAALSLWSIPPTFLFFFF